jgi:lysozyme
MQISTAGRNFIGKPPNEGCKLFPYICPAGKPTIGYGHRISEAEFKLYEKNGISQAQAEDWFTQDLNNAVATVQSLVRVPLRQPQIDALTSFVFNCGQQAFKNSTLLRHVNNRKMQAAALEFTRWCHDDNGKTIPGLLNRRKKEAVMFLSSLPPTSPIKAPQPPLKGK